MDTIESNMDTIFENHFRRVHIHLYGIRESFQEGLYTFVEDDITIWTHFVTGEGSFLKNRNVDMHLCKLCRRKVCFKIKTGWRHHDSKCSFTRVTDMLRNSEKKSVAHEEV